MTVTLFVPVLNELEGLKVIMPRIPKGVFDQILLVDGGSKDGTIEWARENGYELITQNKKGLRHAYTEGFPHIKSEWVMTFSPDGNCLPEDISKIISAWKANPGCDMVIGSRYLGGKKSEDDDVITSFGNWMFTTLINLAFGGHYTDVMNIFRMYRTKMFYDLDIHKDESHNTEKLFYTVVGVEPLISMRAAKRKLKNVDVYCEEPPRLHGVRKLQIFRWGGSHILQVFKEIFWWR
jgi:glycosyltransferase involved in cell wall biosynthesis